MRISCSIEMVSTFHRVVLHQVNLGLVLCLDINVALLLLSDPILPICVLLFVMLFSGYVAAPAHYNTVVGSLLFKRNI